MNAAFARDAYVAAGVPDGDIDAWVEARIVAPRARGYRSQAVTVAEAVELRARGVLSVHAHRCPIILADIRRETLARQPLLAAA